MLNERAAGSYRDVLGTRSGATAVSSLIVAGFLALRVPLLYARQPFFDELFTIWLTRKPYAGILAALHHDSGPPLYYFAVRTLGITTVSGARLLSLVCAAVALLVILAGLRLHARFTAAALLAVFPPAVLFAVDARAYAMCGMFLTIAIAAMERDRPYVAAISLALAAYSHDYGALFFPILLIPSGRGVTFERGRPGRWRGGVPVPSSSLGDADAPEPARETRAIRRPEPSNIVAFCVALLLFAPGIWLALHQPAAAMAWIGRRAGWPEALWMRPPVILVILAVLVAITAGLFPNRFTVMAAIPAAGALLMAVANRPVYLPLRFESLLAVPLVLAIAVSLESWQRPLRIAFSAVLLTAGVLLSYAGIVDHARRPTDDYRAAAQWVAVHVPKSVPVVASGYLYLETIMNGRPDAAAFPQEQAIHPGWRAFPDLKASPPTGEYVWVGERGTPEMRAIGGTGQAHALLLNSRAVVARVR